MTVFEIFIVLCLTHSYISHAYQTITEQKIFRNYPESLKQSEIQVEEFKDYVTHNDTVPNEQPGTNFISIIEGGIDKNYNTSQNLTTSNGRNKRAVSNFKRNPNIFFINSRGHYKFHSSLSKRSNKKDAKIRKHKKKKQHHGSSTSILDSNAAKTTTPFAFIEDGANVTEISDGNVSSKGYIFSIPIDNRKKRPPAKGKLHKKRKHKRPTISLNISGTPNSTELVRSDIGFLIESIKTVSSMKNNGSVAMKKNGWNVFISNEKGSTTTMENAVSFTSLVTEADMPTMKKNGWNVFISNEKGSTTTMENAVSFTSLVTEADMPTNIPTVLMILENFTEALKNEEIVTNQEEMSKSKAIENDLKLLKAIMPEEDTTVQEQPLTEEKAKEEDIQVTYGSPCDYSDNNNSCWYEREVGDTLTLDLNITSSKDESAFVVRWKRMYHKHKQKKCVYIKLETERLPWNMVLGSANRELRIDPITNTDMDPNAISAKIFLVSKTDGKKTYLLIKELTFHIQIPVIDMGSLYPGEELNINLENFLTLPENGNFLFDWKMERPDRKTRTLPSNFKKSTSGRSVVVKEFKRAQVGIIDCVVYSSTGIAVAKRRFSINRLLATSEQKRSMFQDKNQNKRAKRHRQRRIFKRCNKRSNDIPEATALRLLESSRPISRKKRFRKTPTTEKAKKRFVRDCKHHNRLHPRWIPSILDDEDTTLDTRVMSVQKLVELSENSDGTLDDVIPHEVHYVEPMVTVVTDYFLNFWKPPDFQPNCSTDSDCGEGALCIIPQGHKTNKVTGQGHKGYCYCKSAYFGDGFTCIKIPRGSHRDKRIRREISSKSEEFNIQPNLFYDRSMTNAHTLTKKDMVQTLSPLVALQALPLMEYEDEDSYLVGECADRRDCNQHAICFQGDIGHPYCKCNPGYRGNGIFCWEMIDYVKDKDQVTEMAPD